MRNVVVKLGLCGPGLVGRGGVLLEDVVIPIRTTVHPSIHFFTMLAWSLSSSRRPSGKKWHDVTLAANHSDCHDIGRVLRMYADGYIIRGVSKPSVVSPVHDLILGKILLDAEK